MDKIEEDVKQLEDGLAKIQCNPIIFFLRIAPNVFRIVYLIFLQKKLNNGDTSP